MILLLSMLFHHLIVKFSQFLQFFSLALALCLSLLSFTLSVRLISFWESGERLFTPTTLADLVLDLLSYKCSHPNLLVLQAHPLMPVNHLLVYFCFLLPPFTFLFSAFIGDFEEIRTRVLVRGIRHSRSLCGQVSGRTFVVIWDAEVKEPEA